MDRIVTWLLIALFGAVLGTAILSYLKLSLYALGLLVMALAAMLVIMFFGLRNSSGQPNTNGRSPKKVKPGLKPSSGSEPASPGSGAGKPVTPKHPAPQRPAAAKQNLPGGRR